MACERCDKTGDISCIQLLDEQDKLFLAVALHENGTVELPDMTEGTLYRLLAFIKETWVVTSTAIAVILMSPSEARPEDFKDKVSLGFAKLRYFATIDGAVRERMRATKMALQRDAPGRQRDVVARACAAHEA